MNKLTAFLCRVLTLVILVSLGTSCTKMRVKAFHEDILQQKAEQKKISITYPKNSTHYPADFQAPTFIWNDSTNINTNWFACISDTQGKTILKIFLNTQKWKPDSIDWEKLKQNHIGKSLQLTVIGFNKKSKNFASSSSTFSISADSVNADIFFRAVTLPFSFAVRNVHTIEWYMGSVQGGSPRKILDNMPVCANCHSFSEKGPKIAMDVDYGNDKGSYIIVQAKDNASLRPQDIISWSNFKKDEEDPTFGLLSQISPSGKFVLSTVKDLSVFAAVDDNLAYSQLFFPIKGIVGFYDIDSNSFSELQGANNPKYVQSNPVWSPDNKTILFARTEAYINEKVRANGRALLDINDVKEFKDGSKEFKFDIYTVDFNDGKGGIAKPLEGASFNGKSNYFPKYSPDGKWIVFCQSENFMLLQPDSKLYIMNADGTNPRLMNCNTDNMNSWHSWSPNGKWLVFSSKTESLYTRLYLTHIDENGNDSPPILLENLVFDKRAANIPEFFPGKASDFKAMKDEFSNTAAYYTRLATENIKSEYYLRADQNLKKALELDPDYVDAYIVRILLNSILQQVNSVTEKAEKAKAISVVDKQLSQNNQDEELQFLKANLLFANGDYNQSIAILNSILSKTPSFYRAHELLATIYKKLNKPEMALNSYRKMIALVPANGLKINLSIANLYASQKKYSEAELILKQMVKKHPAFSEIHENLCNLYIEQSNLKAAQEELAILFTDDSTNYRLYFLSAQLAETAGSKAKAKEYNETAFKLLQQKLAQNQENIPLLFEKAGYLQQNKDIRGALDIYDKILLNFPSNYKALKEKARIMLMMQQWQEAIALYETLLRNYSPEEEFYNNAAIPYIKIGNYSEALNCFNQTLKLNPSNIDALYNRSKLHYNLGNMQKANEDLETMKQMLKAKKNLSEDEKQLLKTAY